ncbi:MAG: hypothetical protein Q8P11_00130 [bacterium]|nr:hypothetical protein [bacterium]
MKTITHKKKFFPLGVIAFGVCAVLIATVLLVNSNHESSLAATSDAVKLAPVGQRGGIGGGGVTTTPTLQEVTAAGSLTDKTINITADGTTGQLDYLLTLRKSNVTDWGGSAAGILLATEGVSNFGKGGIAFERTTSWARGTIHFLNRNTPDRSLPTLTDSKMAITKEGNVGIGTTNPGAKLDVAGTVKITDGTQGIGKVLTSDDTGLASWQTPTSGGSGGSASPLLFTKGLYPYGADRDATCSSVGEFGSGYHVASIFDVAMHATAAVATGGFLVRESYPANPHLVRGDGTGTLFTTTVYTGTGTGTFKIACVKNDAPLLFTKGSYPYGADRDATCSSVAEFGSGYHVASIFDVAMHATAAAAGSFLVRESSPANPHSVRSDGTGTLFTTTVYTGTGTGTFKIACVR